MLGGEGWAERGRLFPFRSVRFIEYDSHKSFFLRKTPYLPRARNQQCRCYSIIWFKFSHYASFLYLEGAFFFIPKGNIYTAMNTKIALYLLGDPDFSLFKAIIAQKPVLSSKSNFLDQTHFLTMIFSHAFLSVKLLLLINFVCLFSILLFASCISLDSLEYGFAIYPPFRCTCQRDLVQNKCQ